MKLSTKSFLIIAVIVLGIAWAGFNLFKSLSDAPPVAQAVAPALTVDKRERYLRGKEEVITFFSREKEDSDHMIARKAIVIRRPGAKATVFVFHGFMCNKQDIRFLANALFGQPLADGTMLNTVIIDFRGHGEIAEDQCCTLGQDELQDVIGIVNFIKSDPELKDTKRLAYGFSMGAVSSILAQAHDPTLFDAAIWDCPFESTNKLLGRLVEQLKVNWLGYEIPLPGRSLLETYAYNPQLQSVLKFALKAIAQVDGNKIDTCIQPVDTAEAMSKITIPVMLIACRADEKAPVEAVKSVYDAAQGYKRLWITNGRTHFDSYFYNPEKYTYKVRRFVEKWLDGSYKTRPHEYITEDEPLPAK